jgi:hypothetical protein
MHNSKLNLDQPNEVNNTAVKSSYTVKLLNLLDILLEILDSQISL